MGKLGLYCQSMESGFGSWGLLRVPSHCRTPSRCRRRKFPFHSRGPRSWVQWQYSIFHEYWVECMAVIDNVYHTTVYIHIPDPDEVVQMAGAGSRTMKV